MPARSGKRIFVLGLDGLSHSFLEERFKRGELASLKSIASKGAFKRINSAYPTVSSVAWASYMTGENPGIHGILGFVDRDPNPFRIKIPIAGDRKAKTLWGELSSLGKKVIVINVPLTYPPEKVNGILISDFLCTDIDKAAYPSSLGAYLKSRGYIIDVDAWLARESKEKFADQIMLALEKRFEVAFDLMDKEPWDLFQLHIMETDRLFHFFYSALEKGPYNDFTRRFFARLDGFIGQLKEKLSNDDGLLILSDHGFCGIKSEVQINAWLEKEGLLKFIPSAEKKIENYDAASIAYSLIPGRIFVNLEGREEKGSVRKCDYDKVRNDITTRLMALKDDATGEKVIERVFFREEIYDGPCLESAADIIAHPRDGYDLKAKAGGNKIFERTALDGMHTFDDAFCAAVNLDISGVRAIQDPFHAIMAHFGGNA
jgi:predicted AlkP superfamily phosphohydrolase/phosphomutase